MSLELLVELSHYYGTTPGYVLGGGGNTSYKNAAALWVKASGQSLATISAQGFVALDRAKVRQVLTRPYPSSANERENLVLSNLMESRLFPLGRPSVETFLHELMDFPYVVHTHPAAVNAATCALGGRAAFEKRFPGTVWVEYVDPGYLLAAEVARLLQDYRRVHHQLPSILFLENHGLVVGGSSPQEVTALHRSILSALKSEPAPSSGPLPTRTATQPVENLLNDVTRDTGPLSFVWAPSPEVRPEHLASAFTPDHIVYMGVRPLFVAAPEELSAEIDGYRTEFGRDPRVAVIHGLGVVSFASTTVGAELAMALFHDAAAIARRSTDFGGPRFLSAPSIEFILNWEAERFRSKTSGAG